jgi:16S rRNA (uracil1498-N3)-methyltransferase
MSERFFCAEALSLGPLEISGSEHHHMTHVMRLQPGHEVTLFDGSGSEFQAKILDLKRNCAHLSVLSKVEVSRELPFQIIAAVALPKGERQQWLVEKAVELGVSRLVPLITARGVAQPKDKSRARMQRWVVAASKQSGRNRLLEIAPTQHVADFLGPGRAFVAHPSGNATPFSQAIKSITQPEIHLAIGPEGGFTSDELATARNCGCAIVDLGDRVLRVETAMIAMVAGLIYGRG